MHEQFEYAPKYRSQLEIIAHYKDRLSALCQDRVEIRPLTFHENGEVAVRGYKVIIDKRDEEATQGLITDWDDTLETYSNRKLAYFSKLYQNIENKNDLDEIKFNKICSSINKAARILNKQEIHPEAYSPFLEMVTETQFLKDLADSSQEEKFNNLLNSPSEQVAREYIEAVILEKLNGALEIKSKDSKNYFLETRHQSISHKLEEKSDLIDQNVWDSFINTMTGSNLTDQDLAVFDLDDNVYWAISTFGVVEFQLKKILESLEELKAKGKRLPNEITMVTHGRKKLPLLDILASHPDLKWTFLDDSERQLEEIANALEEIKTQDKPNKAVDLEIICAKRPGSKRYNEVSKHKTTDMTAPLSSLLSI